VVLDAFSREIVGWAMETYLRTELVLKALDPAFALRRATGVIHHSDQGSQYTSQAFRKRCEQAGVRPSMGSVGDCFDNAMCESFFANLECELLNREVSKPGRGPHGGVRFHRGLVQPSSPPFGARLSITNQPREESLTTDCIRQPDTVY
jgi:transposase InsO family protein